jgi:hypothetical protein
VVCLIVVPLPPSKIPLAVQLNNNNNNNNNKRNFSLHENLKYLSVQCLEILSEANRIYYTLPKMKTGAQWVLK